MYHCKKNIFLPVLILVALIPAGNLYAMSPIWALILSVACPLAMGRCLSSFLDEHQFPDEFLDAQWDSDRT